MTKPKLPQEWISTGQAARLMGYRSRWGFLVKFKDSITHRVLPSGHYRWLRVDVERLVDQTVVIF